MGPCRLAVPRYGKTALKLDNGGTENIIFKVPV